MNRFLFAVLTAAIIGLLAQPAAALEEYTEEQTQQFVDWCTGEKSASVSTCSCTVQKVAETVPAVALAQFLSSQGSFSLSATAVTTGATVTQALLSCSP